MEKEILEELLEAHVDNHNEIMETTARLMLLVEFLINKGYIDSNEIINALSNEAVDKFLMEAKEVISKEDIEEALKKHKEQRQYNPNKEV